MGALESPIVTWILVCERGRVKVVSVFLHSSARMVESKDVYSFFESIGFNHDEQT